MEEEVVKYSLIDFLSLTSENGSSLIGDLEEEFEGARATLEDPSLSTQRARLATIMEGFNSWRACMILFQATEQEIRMALHQEGAANLTLTEMIGAAKRISDVENVEDTGSIDQDLYELHNAVGMLNGYFPEVRPERVQESFTSSVPQPDENQGASNVPDWVFGDAAGTNTQNAHASASFNPQQSTQLPPGSDARAPHHLDRIDSRGNSRNVVGDVYETPEHAWASNARRINVDRVKVSDWSVNFFGNWHGKPCSDR